MRPTRDIAVVLVTAPSLPVARALVRSVLKGKLAACVNLVPLVESHYRWEGKLERSREVLLILKTTRRRLSALEQRILAEHPYDTAEFIVLPVLASASRYLAWLQANVRA